MSMGKSKDMIRVMNMHLYPRLALPTEEVAIGTLEYRGSQGLQAHLGQGWSTHEKSAFVFPRQRLRVPKCSPELVKLTFSKIATNMRKPGFVIQFHSNFNNIHGIMVISQIFGPSMSHNSFFW